MKVIALAVLMCAAAMGQNAKVVTLSADEAAKAKQLHEAADAAKKAAEDFDKKVAAKYTMRPLQPNETGDPYPAEGWNYGFEFSEDYRFIVPKPYMATAPVNCGGMFISPTAFNAN